MGNLENIKKLLEKIEEKNIKTTAHYLRRSWERPVSEERIRKLLHKPEQLVMYEKQQGDKYKLWFKISGRYCVVVIISITNKSLYIIHAWTGKIR